MAQQQQQDPGQNVDPRPFPKGGRQGPLQVAPGQFVQGSGGGGQGMAAVKMGIMPFDRTVVELDLREPLDIKEDIPTEDQVEELATHQEARQKIEDYMEKEREIYEAGIDEKTLPNYVKIANNIANEEEQGGGPPGTQQASIPGGLVATKEKQTVCLVVVVSPLFSCVVLWVLFSF